MPGHFIVVTSLLFMLAQSGNAQHTVGRWAVSIHADWNAWFNDYNRRIVGLGGDLQARYGLTRAFSLGAEFGYSKFKSGQTPVRPDIPNDYIRLNATPLALLGWYHLLPGKGLSPYFFAGIGVMRYTRSSGLGAYLPDAKSRTTFRIPVGFGLENFVQRRLSFDCNLSYSFFDDHTDMFRQGGIDGAMEVKFGVNLYLGSSDDDDDDRDGLRNVEESRLGTNPTNPDTDEDGLSDGHEVRKFKTDPLNADSDGDRIKDGEEIFKYFTNPLKADTDGDGIDDADEIFGNTDPLTPLTTQKK